MEQLNQLKAYLMRFPLWEDQPLEVDNLQATPEGCGLFPVGVQVIRRREDVLGGQVLHLRQSYLLRRNACTGEEAAAWLLQLQNWLLTQSAKGLEPWFGVGIWLWAEGGRLVNTAQPGTGIYEVKIHVEYEKE